MAKDLDLSCASLDLSSIRLHMPNDLADAQALASHLLDRKGARIVFGLRQMSFDLLTGVLMSNAYTQKDKSLDNVLFFLTDPSWCSKIQILYSFQYEKEPWQQPDAAAWRSQFVEELLTYNHETASHLVEACHAHWHSAFLLAKEEKENVFVEAAKISESNLPLESALRIFKEKAISSAFATLHSMPAERRANGLLILNAAQNDDGLRLIPDTAQAIKNLEAAKAQFENLVEPIERLQLDLVLAGAMPAQQFRIPPMLLLGEPGIGKTYLAMQLAKALGVSSEKISAGGGDASFQLTGSHSTWTGARPGLIVELLAGSKSTSPVLVIDEVDKLSNEPRYSVTPLLLDLLEPHTAQKFKDQFLELEFDASRMVCILTANSLNGIPPALLSRVDVFHIPRPDREQRMRIIQQMHEELCCDSQINISMEPQGCELLASRLDLDLRKLRRLVSEAFARAMRDKKTLAELVVPALAWPDGSALDTAVDRPAGAAKKDWLH